MTCKVCFGSKEKQFISKKWIIWSD